MDSFFETEGVTHNKTAIQKFHLSTNKSLTTTTIPTLFSPNFPEKISFPQMVVKRLKTHEGYIPLESNTYNTDYIMMQSISSMEEILKYRFKNKGLLEEALTHSSWSNASSYERLEFIGDAVLCIAFSMFVYMGYPILEPGQLSVIRAANVSTEKLARLAIRHGFHRYIRINAPTVEANIEEFALKVKHECNAVAHGGRVKAPKVLADIFESVAAAVFVDCGYNLKEFWLIFRGYLEPIAMLEDLQQQPQPVSVLYELCQKQGKQVEFKYWKNYANNIANVFIDGKFIASGYSCQKDSAKIDAAKEALQKLIQFEDGGEVRNGIPIMAKEVAEIKEAKQKLNQFCEKNQWGKPIYKIEKEDGPAHDKRFICSVRIETGGGVYAMPGNEKCRVKDAENSAASMMLQSLQDTF